MVFTNLSVAFGLFPDKDNLFDESGLSRSLGATTLFSMHQAELQPLSQLDHSRLEKVRNQLAYLVRAAVQLRSV